MLEMIENLIREKSYRNDYGVAYLSIANAREIIALCPIYEVGVIGIDAFFQRVDGRLVSSLEWIADFSEGNTIRTLPWPDFCEKAKIWSIEFIDLLAEKEIEGEKVFVELVVIDKPSDSP